jgi:glycosyltransferase involved in cell wall biosynthesis
MTVSDAIAEDLQHRYGLSQTPMVVRNLPPWREPVVDGRLRQALGLNDDAQPLALYQGGFLTDNGLTEVIEAMRQIDNGRLVLLGGGPTEQALRQQVADAERRQQLGIAARQAAHKYCWENEAPQLLKLYESL